MTTFVDTSALFSLLDADDALHAQTLDAFATAREDGPLATHSYVLVETSALVHRRLGKRAATGFLRDVVPAMQVRWVDAGLHDDAARAFAASRSTTSFVDHVSFALMEREEIARALAIDRDFRARGYAVLP